MVERTPRWAGRVVYGDTDSMFVLLEGRSVAEAFKIGEEIADVVTKMNPSPVRDRTTHRDGPTHGQRKGIIITKNQTIP